MTPIAFSPILIGILASVTSFLSFLIRFLRIPTGFTSAELTDVVIESVDLSLYIAHARLNGEERLIADRNGKVLKTRNLLEMQRTIRKAVTCELFLRQRSAYDEMVGHNYQATDNVMELPLGREPLPEWLN